MGEPCAESEVFLTLLLDRVMPVKECSGLLIADFFILGRSNMQKPQASIAIQVLPNVQKEDIIKIVDEVIDYIKGTGLNYFVSPFETTVEGDFDDLMDIIKNANLICIKAGAPGVMSYVKISLGIEGV